MQRYYFHIQTDSRVTDHDGYECAGPVEARMQAIVTCGEMMKEAPEIFWGSRPWSDAKGLILWEVFMDDVTSAAATHLE